ncbi:hypothetical protein CEXT_771361 [Caerostris extrusa]|uniref:Secreted protein n=1 Tax=Caerostris extrusa TaxID=172846 RepID=A0AAV4S9L1_CAEEX|nr:hypothetical protein CEXT_771361 [Caerostris extrusa]
MKSISSIAFLVILWQDTDVFAVACLSRALRCFQFLILTQRRECFVESMTWRRRCKKFDVTYARRSRKCDVSHENERFNVTEELL